MEDGHADDGLSQGNDGCALADSVLLLLSALSASCSFSLFQLIDYFLVFALATGVIQFLYMLLVGQFPFNSFLAGFLAAVGFFVFTGQWNLP